MDYGELRARIIEWLDDNYHFGDAESLIPDDDASFLDHGILDSLGFVQLILLLEDTLEITITRKDLNRDNFDGMRKIIDYVQGHPDYRP